MKFKTPIRLLVLAILVFVVAFAQQTIQQAQQNIKESNSFHSLQGEELPENTVYEHLFRMVNSYNNEADKQENLGFSQRAYALRTHFQYKDSKTIISDKKLILKAELDDSEFQLGNPIELTLTIKNETDSTIVLFDVEPERGFDITIADMNGLKLSLTKEGKKRKYPTNIVRRETVFLEPSKELILRNIRLDKLFDFKRKGIYKLEVKRSYYLQGSSIKNTELEKTGILTSVIKFSIK